MKTPIVNIQINNLIGEINITEANNNTMLSSSIQDVIKRAFDEISEISQYFTDRSCLASNEEDGSASYLEQLKHYKLAYGVKDRKTYLFALRNSSLADHHNLDLQVIELMRLLQSFLKPLP